MDRDDCLCWHGDDRGRMPQRRGRHDFAGGRRRNDLGRRLYFERRARRVRRADLVPYELLGSNRRRRGA